MTISHPPDLLTTLYENIISDDHIVLSFCQSYRVNNKGGDVTGDWLSHTQEYDLDNIFTEDFTMEGKEFIRKFLIHKNTIPNASGVLFEKVHLRRLVEPIPILDILETG